MVDEVDEKILQLLEQNSRATYVEIGHTIGLSEGAVRNRVQGLVENGVIKKFTIEKSLKIGVRALIMIAVDPGTPTLEVSRKIMELNGVEKIYEVTGEYDIVMVSSAVNIDGINRCIEEIRN
jgi:DNA-binding Lrp family transcriptional regulator